MNSAPWGTLFNTEYGTSTPVYDFATHKQFLQSTENDFLIYTPEHHDGGYVDGNTYSSIQVPHGLRQHIGLIIGRQGKNFIHITKKTGVIAVWYDPMTNDIQIIAGDTRYFPHEDWSLPGYFDLPDDFPEDEEYGDILDGIRIIESARQEIFRLFEKTTHIAYNNYLRDHRQHLVNELLKEPLEHRQQFFKDEIQHIDTLLRIPY